jgi:quercetin dioxygenase-like cupin family protein
MSGRKAMRFRVVIVTAGCGWVKCADGPKREICAGDVVVYPPGRGLVTAFRVFVSGLSSV